MNPFSRERIKRFSEMAFLVRLVSILFIIMALFRYYPYKGEFPETIISLLLVLLIISLAMWSGGSYAKYENQAYIDQHPSRLDYLSAGFSLVFIFLVILFTGGAASHFKILFFPVALFYTVKFGRWWGIGISLFIAVFLMSINYYSYLQGEVVYIEIDVVYVGMFLLTSWMVGNIVDMERGIISDLSRQVMYDELTGLFNHRHFQDSINERIEQEAEFTLMMVDLDYFKQFNETFGYQKGDRVLIEISRFLSELTRQPEQLFRYGRDEFAFIIPGSAKNRAVELAEQIRVKVKRINLDLTPSEVFWEQLSVSIGIAVFPEDAFTKQDLLSKVDEALYRARVISGDRVEAYFSMLEQLKPNPQDEDETKKVNYFKTFLSIIHARDRFTYGHCERVLIYCNLLSSLLELDEETKRNLQYGAFLHDIGKIEIDRYVLNKSTSLTEEEWNIIKNHPQWGAEIVHNNQELEQVIPLILYHHERYDGKGYPYGLAKETIPFGCRVLHVANAFDFMTVEKPYRKAMSFQEAISELESNCYTQFDPQIVDVFVKHLKKYRDIREVIEEGSGISSSIT